MKLQSFLILTAANLFSAMAFSQVQRGAVETSCSFAYGAVSMQSHTSGKGVDLTTSSDPVRYFTTALRVGYFVSNPMEIGPEVQIFASSRSLPVSTVTFNLTYNFKIKESKFLPFALFGLGFSNGVPGVTMPVIDSLESSRTYSALNLGCGVRYFLDSRIAIRGEYRYQLYRFRPLRTEWG